MSKCKFCGEKIEEKRADALFCDVKCRSNHAKNVTKDRIYIEKKDGFYRLTLRKTTQSRGVIYVKDAPHCVNLYGYQWREDGDGVIELLLNGH